jgi:capsular polysaccharide biosynthesis protein
MSEERMGGPRAEGLELVALLRVLRRRAWLVLGLPAAVLVLSLATYRAPPPSYQARLAFAVDVPRSAIVVGSDEGTAAKIGEALVDDISRILPRDVFAAAVVERLPEGLAVAPGELASETSATDRHRVADLTVTRALPPGADAAAFQGELATVAEAVLAELQENADLWFARLGEDEVRLTVIDRPDVMLVEPGLRERLELPLRLLLALAAGLGLALVLHALDPRLYTGSEVVAATGAPLLGWLPAESGAGSARGPFDDASAGGRDTGAARPPAAGG